jgi:drug/metabolite transporter (DMT)-like permease
MPEFAKLIWDICCLRRGPQDLPYAPVLLATVCAAFLGLEALLAMDVSTIGVGAVALAINMSVLYSLLYARGVSNRFLQTATALFGCALLFALLMLPFQLLLGDPKDNQPSPGRALIVIVLLLFCPGSWSSTPTFSATA